MVYAQWQQHNIQFPVWSYAKFWETAEKQGMSACLVLCGGICWCCTMVRSSVTSLLLAGGYLSPHSSSCPIIGLDLRAAAELFRTAVRKAHHIQLSSSCWPWFLAIIQGCGIFLSVCLRVFCEVVSGSICPVHHQRSYAPAWGP